MDYLVDVNTQEQKPGDKLQLNDIAVADLTFSQPVVVDAYPNHRFTGSFIVIDRLTNITVGAGMVIEGLRRTRTSHAQFSEFELEFNALVRKHFPHWDAKDISKL